MSEWQPIETAPKDGTVIDVWLGDANDDERQFYCCGQSRRAAGWRWRDGKFRPTAGLMTVPVLIQPTHWMPLPEPPK